MTFQLFAAHNIFRASGKSFKIVATDQIKEVYISCEIGNSLKNGPALEKEKWKFKQDCVFFIACWESAF